MGNMISILFYVRKSRPNPLGQIPIYLRVTVAGECFEAASGRFVDPEKWSPSAGKAIGNGKESKELNEFLDVL